MSVRSHYKLLGAAGAAALTVGVLAGPAVAAGEETATVNYTCTSPAGDATPSATYAVNKPPATMIAGQVIKLPATATFTLDAGTTGLATVGLGWKSFGGTLKTTPTATRTGLNMTLEKTPLANGPAGTTVANVSGKALLRGFKAGTYTLKLGNIGHVHLQGYDAADNPLSPPVDFPTKDNAFKPCVNNAGATTLRDALSNPATVKVTKDKTTTAVVAAYNGKKNIATGKAKVKSHFGLKPTGKVKFTLKKGSHVVKTLKASVNKKGIAKATFKHVSKKGKYSITGKYLGNKALKVSSGKDTFRV